MYQVYISALDGHVPAQMVCCIWAFLEFCYIVRKDKHNETTLCELERALTQFHFHHEIFITTGVRQSFNLPWQHSMLHYITSIRAYGSPNGLCSSITESKHIKAVKKPWRQSNRYEAIGQMLLTNQRLDKLAAFRVELTRCGMLEGTCISDAIGIYLHHHSMSWDNNSFLER
jgi:hypothetical protein